MKKSLTEILKGYHRFREKYVVGDSAVMEHLANHGQKPDAMLISCCDSRVDPAVILQCDPGDLFVIRNIANIVPPYESDKRHHGTSASLEFGICYLNVKHLIILGHSQCGGINALLNSKNLKQNDFLTDWMSIIDTNLKASDADSLVKKILLQSYNNCLTFPWIKERAEKNELTIHLWFFEIKTGEIFNYSFEDKQYKPLAITD